MVKHNKNFCHLFVIDQNKGQDFVSCFYDEDFLLIMEKFVVVVFVLVFTNILKKGERWKQKKKILLVSLHFDSNVGQIFAKSLCISCTFRGLILFY